MNSVSFKGTVAGRPIAIAEIFTPDSNKDFSFQEVLKRTQPGDFFSIKEIDYSVTNPLSTGLYMKKSGNDPTVQLAKFDPRHGVMDYDDVLVKNIPSAKCKIEGSLYITV